MKPGPAPSRRKTEIREAALTLFAERGYHGTGMEDIARLVGIRASSLYNHMSSKQELLADIMITTMRELLSRFNEVTTEASRPADQLRLAVEAHVRYHAIHRRDVRIGNREIPSLEEPAQTQVRQLRRDYARAWQHMIESGVADGDFTTLSPQLAAYALLEMGIGVSQWYREDGALSLDEIAFHYADMALRQLGVADETG
ncbi:MAG: Transcriptional regulator, TetR family [Pseudonocardiales bacterium]|nr:Transcriptional regulator, TetR family [Pseudonocardiales bacterium]